MSNTLQDNQIFEIDSWEEFQKIISGSEYKRWAFRGQEKSEWTLDSTLRRYLIDFKLHRESWAHQEDRILRLFRRKAQNLLTPIPAREDIFDWLALMQHYGAPTRLMDFTWSPYVAAFFGLEKAKEEDSAVWAINFAALRNREYQFPQEEAPSRAPKPEDLESFRRFFIQNKVPFLATGEPYNMNQRQIAQSGTFLIPGVIDQPIENILASWDHPEKLIVKFVLRTSMLRDEAMESLYYMNITNATLFPGLEGLARSLAYELEFHWGFNPKTMKNHPGSDYFDLDEE